MGPGPALALGRARSNRSVLFCVRATTSTCKVIVPTKKRTGDETIDNVWRVAEEDATAAPSGFKLKILDALFSAKQVARIQNQYNWPKGS